MYQVVNMFQYHREQLHNLIQYITEEIWKINTSFEYYGFKLISLAANWLFSAFTTALRGWRLRCYKVQGLLDIWRYWRWGRKMSALWLKSTFIVGYIRKRYLISLIVGVGVRAFSNNSFRIFRIVSFFQSSRFLGFNSICCFIAKNKIYRLAKTKSMLLILKLSN